jgi:hypothetical protein
MDNPTPPFRRRGGVFRAVLGVVSIGVGWVAIAYAFFGPFYLASKGVWGAAAFWIFFGICTLGVTWLILPFFAEGLLRKHYLRLGWSEVPKPRKPEPGIRPPGKALR